ncbi:MAG: AIR carboxylase family protein [Spirochaetes bacterium]|nr:AIR carboxylase family protein [Spirochaetota bacterium]
MGKAVIIMGSSADKEHCEKIKKALAMFNVDCVMRVASAHKVPLKALEIVREYENEHVVFITVAGRSNALSGFVDANTMRPVIACPPYGEKFSGADIFSTIRMPSGVAPMLVLEPAEAALAAAKIFALTDKAVAMKVVEFQKEKREEIEKADEQMRGK